MNNLKHLIKKILIFRQKRDWKKFHNPKNLAISLSIEANELLEKFQWLNEKESQEVIKNKNLKKEIEEEIADVFYYLLLLSYELNINLEKTFEEKMRNNEKKYPVEKAKGKALKYNKL
ncbi:MAG: nucleotide pyrophosphohydrolase [Microgenomates group bacterium]